MRRIIRRSISFFVSAVTLLPVVVLAAHSGAKPHLAGQGSSWTGLANFYGGICSIANWFFGIVLVLAIIAILYSAFLFLTSSGSPEKVGRARTLLLWALFGIGIAFLARAFVFVVGNLVGGDLTPAGGQAPSLGC